MLRFARALRPRRARGLVIAAVALTSLVSANTALAQVPQSDCDERVNNTYKKVLECVRVSEVREHQAALQAIADANGGTREAGTSGYTGSVDYVVDTLEAAGWIVSLDEFPFTYIPPSTLRQLTPTAATYETGAYTGSGTGVVQGPVIPVDLNLAPPRATTSGCEASDFAGIDWSGPNNIALIQRGTCSFGIKAINAQTAGAEAVIIFNQGNTPLREGLIVGTLLPDGAAVTIPVVGASFADGAALAQSGSTGFIEVAPAEARPQVNVIAGASWCERRQRRHGRRASGLGAGGPGDQRQRQRLGRAARDGAAARAPEATEHAPLRLVGRRGGGPGRLDRLRQRSQRSREGQNRALHELRHGRLAELHLHGLRRRPVGLPGSGVPVPHGSVAIEDIFESFYTLSNEPYDDAAFDARSDYQAFIPNGIPSSGLFTGAEVPKTAEQQSIWGGTVGAQFDPCYHLACDTFANNNDHALGVNANRSPSRR